MGDDRPEASHRSFLIAVGLYAAILAVSFIGLLVPALAAARIALVNILLPACLLWLWHRDGNALLDVGFGRRGAWKRSLGIGFMIGLIIPLAVVVMLIGAGLAVVTAAEWQEPSGWQMPIYAIMAILMVLSTIKLAFIVPIEEIVFRGLYLKQLRPGLGLFGALAASSLFFSLLHAPGMISDGVWACPLLIGLLAWFIFGCALGVGTLRSHGLLWLPIGVHFGYNLFFSSISLFLSVLYNAPVGLAYRGPEWLTGQTRWSPETGVAGLALEILLLVAVWLVTAGARNAADGTRSKYSAYSGHK